MQLVYDSPSVVDAVVGGDINKRGKQVGHSVLPGSSIQPDLLRSQTVKTLFRKGAGGVIRQVGKLGER